MWNKLSREYTGILPVCSLNSCKLVTIVVVKQIRHEHKLNLQDHYYYILK